MPGEGEACSTDELPLRVLSLESGHCINIIRFNQAVGNASFSLCLFFFLAAAVEEGYLPPER